MARAGEKSENLDTKYDLMNKEDKKNAFRAGGNVFNYEYGE
jgi:hypothetical protein